MTVELYEIPANFREVKSFGLYHVSWCTYQLTWYKFRSIFSTNFGHFWSKIVKKINALGTFYQCIFLTKSHG